MIDNEKYQRIMARDNYTCMRCGKTGIGLELAHRVKRGKGTAETLVKYFRQAYQKELSKKECEDIIDDDDNLVVACSGSCNSSYNIFFRPIEAVELIEKIGIKKGIISWGENGKIS